MQLLKTITNNGLMRLVLSFGLTVSATAAELSFEEVKAIAERGDPLGQTVLGGSYSNRQGVRQDYSKSLEWFKKSAKQNNPAAQIHIGVIYQNGEGVRQNMATAQEWFGKACDNGAQMGCDNYKKLNEQGY